MKALFPGMGIAATLALMAQSMQAAIIGIEIPSRSGYNGCSVDLIYNPGGQINVTAPPFPLDTAWSSGIGYLLNPEPDFGGARFGLHGVALSNVPTVPGGATVTYRFDRPTTVDQLEIIQHANGVSRVEGFVGNDLGSLVSIGNIFGPAGDVTGPVQFLPDGSPYVFDFDNTTEGTYFQFKVTKTSLENGWALYRAFPLTADGVRIELATEAYSVPEPAECGLIVGLGLAAFGFYRRMRP